MLAPRIYRTGLIVVVLGLIVFAFSLTTQPSALSPNLSPTSYSPGFVTNLTKSLAKQFPNRAPSSSGDTGLAGYVVGALQRYGFGVSEQYNTGATATGTRTLETVIGTRTGIASGTIVVVAPRDVTSGPPQAGVSGTAALIGLAQTLEGTSHHNTIMLVSTSGTVGGAGSSQLAQILSQNHVDAVIVLGDLVRAQPDQPIVVPWSEGQTLAPPLLRNTLAAAVAAQSSLRSSIPSVAAELAHGAFPLTISPQGPLGSAGYPAVYLSTAGERGSTPGEAVNLGRAGALGAAVLQTVGALDNGPTVPSPSAYLMLDGQIVPWWAVRLLVLTLILPVLAVTIDAAARVKRRGFVLTRWIGWVLAGAVPFLIGLVIVRVADASGWITAPPGPVGPGAVALHGAGIALLAVVALALIVSFWLLRPLCVLLFRALGRALTGPESERAAARRRAVEAETPGLGAAAALLVVMCVVTLALWVANPLAAVLLVPALHLWIWAVDPDVPMRRAGSIALVLLGLVPPALVVVYYVQSLGLSPVDVFWNGALMVGGGHIPIALAVLWSLALGCLASALVIAVRSRHERRAEPEPVTVRGPVTYAGPGSLGGTESALRR